MNSTRTVNEVLDRLCDFEGQPVELEGVLELHEEGYELLHFPKVERATQYEDEERAYRSGVWLAFGNGSIQPNHNALKRWQGKRVRVHGLIHGLPSLPSHGVAGKGGFGPWGFWPAEVEPFSIQRVTAEERRERGA